MAEAQIVQIRKKGGLNTILKNKQGSTINPMLYKSKTRNVSEEGIPEGDYRGRTILDTKHFIAPIWSDTKGQWSWSGSAEDLVRVINAMKLRYPKNHQRAGQIIEPGPNVADRLINRRDEIFNHPDLYGKYYMEQGRISLNLSDPKQEFLFKSYKGDHNTEDKSSDEVISKFIAAGTKYELISPRKEHIKAKSLADKDVRAIVLLHGMDNNEDRMRSIARIMSLPKYNESTDVSGVFVLLKDTAAQNTQMSSKYNKSYQDRFIELAEMTDDELNLHSQVVTAKEKTILRKRQGFYLFNGEKLENIDSDSQLIKFFRDPKNQDKYLELIDLITTDTKGRK